MSQFKRFNSSDNKRWDDNNVYPEGTLTWDPDNGLRLHDGSNVRGAWTLGTDGNLTLPTGGVITETSIPSGGLDGNTIALKPNGGTNSNQQLLVYPTGNPDYNHLHLTSGNLYDTELFLGDDNFYVKLANTGNIVLNSNDNNGNTSQWRFNTDGSMYTIDELTIKVSDGIPTSLSKIGGNQGWGAGSVGSNLPTTGGSGTGLTVDVVDSGSAYSGITIHTAGTGYTDGDIITVSNGGMSDSFTISVPGYKPWVFGMDGNLTVPGNLVANSASPAPSISGFDSISGLNFNAGGNILANSVYTDNYYYANGAPLEIPSGSTSVTTTGNVTAGNVIAGNFSGNGNQLTSIAGANVRGTVANATYAVTAGTANSVAVANVSGIGNIATINKDGNASNILYGNGVFAAAPAGGSSYSNSNVANYIPNYTGTLTSVGTITANGNITSNNITSNGNVQVGSALQIIGSTNTLQTTNGSAIQFANRVNFNNTGNYSFVASGNVSASYYFGTIGTASQPNITSVGTLSSVAVTANANVGNLNATGRVYANDTLLVGSTGGEGGQITIGWVGVNNFTGQANGTWNMDVDSSNNFRVFYQNASGGTGEAIKAYSSNSTVLFGSNIVVTGNATVQGTLTYNNLSSLTTSNLVLGLANNQTGVNVTGGGIVVGNTAEASFTYNYSSNVWSSNIGITATGNVTGANINTAGKVVASTLTSNVATGTAPFTVTSTTQVANLNVANAGLATYATTANSVAVANVSGIGNIATINKDGNSSNILYGNGVFASAPVTYGNSNVATFLASYGSNTISTTGNVTVGNIIGNGQALTGLAGANVTGAVAYATTANAVAGANVSGQVGNALVAGTVYTAAQPNITSTGTLTSLTVTGNVTGGNLTSSAEIAGYGALTLGNIANASATKTRVVTAGNISYIQTGNGTAGSTGNVVFSPTLDSNARVTIDTSSGNLSATGNITGANLIAGTSGQGNVYASNIIVNGQPTTYGVVNGSYLFAYNNADQTSVGQNGAVNFQVTSSSNGSLITKTSNSQITLKAGNTYALKAVIGRLVSSSTWAQFRWYDVTNAAYVGAEGFSEVVSSSGAVGSTIVPTAYVTPGVNTTYELRQTTTNTITVNAYASMEVTQVNPTIAVQATASGTVAKNYAKYTRTASQSVSANSVIICNVLENTSGTALTVNTSTGQVTLTAGTYRLRGTIGTIVGSTADSRVGYGWYNETTSAWVGEGAGWTSPQAQNWNSTTSGTAEYVITVASTSVVSFRVIYVSNVTSIGGNGSDFAGTYANPWIDIEQMGATFALNSVQDLTVGTNTVPGNLVVNGNITYNGATVTTGTITADYIQVEKSADQTFVAKNADINFNVTTATNGGIAYASNIFTLTAGKTYLLEATLCVNTFTSNSAYIWYSWVDATTNAQLDTSNGAATSTGSSGVAVPATWTANDNYSSSARLIYTPNNNQTVKLRATDGSGTCTVLVIGTRATIKQINPSFAFSNQVAVGGNLTVAGNLVVSGNITGNIASRTTGSWTVTAGAGTYSLTVPINGTYSIWVIGSIPSGIITYTATAVVTNTNVPVLGTSYGWYYAAGNALVLTSMPTQFVGTVNNISNAVVSTTTANVFTFGITNNSGSSQVVNWGYTKL